MKIIFTLLLGLIVFSGVEAVAQKKTVILLRHAEKAPVTAGMNASDPDLSDVGKERAERLARALRKFKPSAIYVSEYKRTTQTVAPLAAKRKITTQNYEVRKLQDLATLIKDSKARRIVVAGHNNTTPALANMLMSSTMFKDLGENEYDKIFILRFRDGKLKNVEIRTY